jgi:hypothetical protein
MKSLLTHLFLLISYIGFCQQPSKNYDYFVQYNGAQFTKKVKIEQLTNHPLLNKLQKENPDFDTNEFTALFDLEKNASVVGNFTDSIAYYQATIPIKNKKKLKAFLTKRNEKKALSDSITKFEIQDFGSYSMLNSNDQKFTMAWDDSYLVFFELTKKYSDIAPDVGAVDSVTVPAETYDDATETTAVQEVQEEIVDDIAPAADAAVAYETNDATTEDTYTNDTNYAAYEAQRIAFDSIQKIKQINFTKLLFEKGFIAPTSSKINPTADISSWVNYGGFLSNLSSSFSTLTQLSTYSKYLPLQKGIDTFIKGMNFDFYFDNDNARIEETIEYSKSIADMMGKINARKINKKIFAYFPEQEPLGYFSYHFNSKALLENMPQMIGEIFSNTVFLNEDFSFVTDLITTLVDEKAAATLFDGDISLFLHELQPKEVKTRIFEYDENYETVEVEKKVTKTMPTFTMIFTATHASFYNKLIDLGVRKKMLLPKNGFYEIVGTNEFGTVYIVKDQDVLVVTNLLEQTQPNEGTFKNGIQKSLKENTISAAFDIQKMADTFLTTEKDNTKDQKYLKAFASKFKTISMQSPKKLSDNKLKVDVRLNTVKGDKNIMLQTLDLIDEISQK